MPAYGITFKIHGQGTFVSMVFDSREAWLCNEAPIGQGISLSKSQSRRNAEWDAEAAVLWHDPVGIMKIVTKEEL